MFPLLGRNTASHENMVLLSLKNLLKNQLCCWSHECVFVQWFPSAECTDTDEHEKRLNLLLTHCGLSAAADRDWDGPRPARWDLSVESRLLNDKMNSLN